MADPVFEAFLGGGGVGDDAGLNAFRETVRSNDYFRQAAAPILTTKLNTSMMDPWTAFGTTAAQAFLGSALNTLGKNREAEQLFKAAEILPSLQKPDINSILGVQAPEGIDPEAFGALKLNAIRDMFKRNNETERAKTLYQAQSDIRFSEAEKMLPLAERQAIADAKGKIKGTIEGYGGVDAFSKLPDSPQAHDLKRLREEEDSARSEIGKLPAVAKFNLTNTALAQLKPLKDLDTGTSDIPFATLFLQGLDGSVVKEGEYNRIAGTNPIIEKYRNQMEAALNGTSGLSVGTKRQMYNELSSMQKGLFEAAKAQALPRAMTAIGRGVTNPANILPFDPTMTFEEAQSAAAAVAAPTKVVNGRTYVQVPGGWKAQ